MRLSGHNLVILAFSLCACSRLGFEDPPGARQTESAPARVTNRLVNPGFEEGRFGWNWDEKSQLWANFKIVDAPVRSGSRAVHLPVDSSAYAQPGSTRVFGLFQELTADPFPERVSGYYRVDQWQNEAKGTDLYIQVVVVVFGDPRAQEILKRKNPQARPNNYQVRYYLAGAPKVAINISNAKIEIQSGDPPALGKWVRFDLPIREDFQRVWGVVPERYEKLRFLFEARWDNHEDMDAVVKADVYYDDLYAGAQDAASE